MIYAKSALIGVLIIASGLAWGEDEARFPEYAPDHVIPIQILGTEPQGYLLIFYGQARTESSSASSAPATGAQDSLVQAVDSGYQAKIMTHGAIPLEDAVLRPTDRFGDQAPELSFLSPMGFNLTTPATAFPIVMNEVFPWQVAKTELTQDLILSPMAEQLPDGQKQDIIAILSRLYQQNAKPKADLIVWYNPHSQQRHTLKLFDFISLLMQHNYHYEQLGFITCRACQTFNPDTSSALSENLLTSKDKILFYAEHGFFYVSGDPRQPVMPINVSDFWYSLRYQLRTPQMLSFLEQELLYASLAYQKPIKAEILINTTSTHPELTPKTLAEHGLFIDNELQVISQNAFEEYLMTLPTMEDSEFKKIMSSVTQVTKDFWQPGQIDVIIAEAEQLPAARQLMLINPRGSVVYHLDGDKMTPVDITDIESRGLLKKNLNNASIKKTFTFFGNEKARNQHIDPAKFNNQQKQKIIKIVGKMLDTFEISTFDIKTINFFISTATNFPRIVKYDLYHELSTLLNDKNYSFVIDLKTRLWLIEDVHFINAQGIPLGYYQQQEQEVMVMPSGYFAEYAFDRDRVQASYYRIADLAVQFPPKDLEKLRNVFEKPKTRLEYIARLKGLSKHIRLSVPVTEKGQKGLQQLQERIDVIKRRLSVRFGIESSQFETSLFKESQPTSKDSVATLLGEGTALESLELPKSPIVQQPQEPYRAVLTTHVPEQYLSLLDKRVYTKLPDYVLEPRLYHKPNALQLLLYKGHGHKMAEGFKNKQLTILARGQGSDNSVDLTTRGNAFPLKPNISFFSPYGYRLKVLSGAASHLIDRQGLWQTLADEPQTALYLSAFDYAEIYDQAVVKQFVGLYQSSQTTTEHDAGNHQNRIPESDLLIVDYIDQRQPDQVLTESLALDQVLALLSEAGFHYQQIAVLADRVLQTDWYHKLSKEQTSFNLDFDADALYFVYGTENEQLMNGFGVESLDNDFEMLHLERWWQGLRYGLLSPEDLTFQQKQLLLSSLSTYAEIKWFLYAETTTYAESIEAFFENFLPIEAVRAFDKYLSAINLMSDDMFQNLLHEVQKSITPSNDNEVNLIFVDGTSSKQKKSAKKLAMKNPKATFIFDALKDQLTLVSVTKNKHHRALQNNSKLFSSLISDPLKYRGITFLGDWLKPGKILGGNYYNKLKKINAVSVINLLIKQYGIHPDSFEFINYFDTTDPGYPGKLFNNMGLIHSDEFQSQRWRNKALRGTGTWEQPVVEITTVSNVSLFTPLGGMISELSPNNSDIVYEPKTIVDVVSTGWRGHYLDHIELDQGRIVWFPENLAEESIDLTSDRLHTLLADFQRFLNRHVLLSERGHFIKSYLVNHLQEFLTDRQQTIEPSSAWSPPQSPSVKTPGCHIMKALPDTGTTSSMTRFKRAVLTDCTDEQTLEETSAPETLNQDQKKAAASESVADLAQDYSVNEQQAAYRLFSEHKATIMQLAAYPQIQALGMGQHFEPIIDIEGQLRVISQQDHQLVISDPIQTATHQIKDQVQKFNTQFSQLYEALGTQQKLSVSQFWLLYAAIDYARYGVDTNIRSLLNAAVFFPSAVLETLHFPVALVTKLQKISVLKNSAKIQQAFEAVMRRSLKIQHLLGGVGKGLQFFGSGVMLYNLIDDIINKPDFNQANSEAKTLWGLHTATDAAFALEAGMGVVDVVSGVTLVGAEFLGPIGLALFTAAEGIEIFYREKHLHKMLSSENHWLLEERDHYLAGTCREVLKHGVAVLDCSRSLMPIAEITLNASQSRWRYGDVRISKSVLSRANNSRDIEPIADPSWSNALDIIPIFQEMARWQQDLSHRHDTVILPAIPNKQVLYDYRNPGVTTEAMNAVFLSTGSLGLLSNKNRVSQFCTGDAFATRSQVLDKLRRTQDTRKLVSCLEVATKHRFCPEIVQLWGGGDACQVGYFKYDLASDIRVATHYRYHYQPTSVTVRLEGASGYTLVTPALISDSDSSTASEDRGPVGTDALLPLLGKITYDIQGNGQRNTLFLQYGSHYTIEALTSEETWFLVLPKHLKLRQMTAAENQTLECLQGYFLELNESKDSYEADSATSNALRTEAEAAPLAGPSSGFSKVAAIANLETATTASSATQLCFKGHHIPSVYTARQ